MSRIAAIKDYGQKIWLDYLSRELLASGQLQQLIQDDGIAGITSNPVIFLKALSTDPRYQEQLIALKNSSLTPIQRYEQIALSDIKSACTIFTDLYQATQGEDGYVSLEVAPNLCHDAAATIASAVELWRQVNAPNLMLKVPATAAGVIAFERLIELGINVNITLLFSLPQVTAIWEAYLRALNTRLSQNLPINNLKAVASFFLSRVDAKVDPLLPAELQGQTALSLARQAYLNYQQIFHTPRFSHYKAHGAKPQYLLWASTGTKNPHYSDVLYLEQLITAETINTAPEATLAAFRDHGQIAQQQSPNNAASILAQVEQHGINLAELGQQLQQEGLELFEQAFTQLLELVK